MRIKILSQAGHKYLGLAKKWFKSLEDQRLDLRLPILSRIVICPGNVRVELYSSEWANWITIRGGSVAIPLILFSGSGGFSEYNYYNNKLKSVTNTAQSGELSPIYNGRSQVQEKLALTFQDSWAEQVLGGQEYISLGGVNTYEMAIFAGGSLIYGRVEDTIGLIAATPNLLQTEYSHPYGNLFGLAARKSGGGANWNRYNGIILYTLNVANQKVLDSWYWIPSFFTAAPADNFDLKPGFYYGSYPSSPYGIENDLESLSVTFLNLLDSRYTGGSYSYGWAEVVTKVNDSDVQDLYVYLQGSVLGVPSNNTFGNVRVAGTTADQFITVGNELRGYTPTLTIPLSSLDQVTGLDMWNFRKFTIQGQDSAVCFAVHVTRAGSPITMFCRFTGVLEEFYTAPGYVSHSTSRDGKILAVFNHGGVGSDQSLIASVHVFDLGGVREKKQGSTYTEAGITDFGASPISDSANTVADLEAVTGCVIPFREEGVTPVVLPYSLADVEPSSDVPEDYTNFLPSLSILDFPLTGRGSPEIKKVVVTNGVSAVFGISQDECFESTVIVSELGSSDEKVIGSWAAGGVIQGLVRGSYTNDHPAMRFAGEGSGTLVTLPETFTIFERDTGGFGIEGYTGELSLGSCIIEGVEPGVYELDPECDVPGCPDDPIELTASSSCGQSASLEIDRTPLDALTIAGPEYAEVGDEYVASGGLGPYTFEFTGGTVTEDGGTATIDTVDSCGTGSWSLTFQFTACNIAGVPDGYGYWDLDVGRMQQDVGFLDVGPFTIPVQETASLPAAVWRARRSAETTCNSSFTGSVSGRWYKMNHHYALPGPENRFNVYHSTNYNCDAAITVTDACGSTAQLAVSAVP